MKNPTYHTVLSTLVLY